MSKTLGGFDDDVLKVFYYLPPRQLEDLFNEYGGRYGAQALGYARNTYPKWRRGRVTPSGQTVGRLLEILPLVIGFDVKCDLLKSLRERHRSREAHRLDVTTSDWREAIIPLVSAIIKKAYTASLPEAVEQRLAWLSSGDMQAANRLLAHTEAYQGALSMSLLSHEFAEIDAVLASLKGSKVRHTIILPYGTIALTIKRSNVMPEEKHLPAAPRRDSIFKPRAEDIFDEVFGDLDEEQARQVKARAAAEALSIVAEKKRADAKTANAREEMRDFIENAELMDRRRRDYKMQGRFNSASGSTDIQVGRNWSATLIGGGVVAVAAVLIILYVFRHLL